MNLSFQVELSMTRLDDDVKKRWKIIYEKIDVQCTPLGRRTGKNYKKNRTDSNKK